MSYDDPETLAGPDEPPHKRCPRFATSDPHAEHWWHDGPFWYECDGGMDDYRDEQDAQADAEAPTS